MLFNMCNGCARGDVDEDSDMEFEEYDNALDNYDTNAAAQRKYFVTVPLEWLNREPDGTPTIEEGSNMMEGPVENVHEEVFKAYCAGKNYIYYNWEVDYVGQRMTRFLRGNSQEDQARWRQEQKQEEGESEEPYWYVIIQGTDVGIYEDYAEFQRKRDANFVQGQGGHSKKARWFRGQKAAKKWCQMVRDTEGGWWRWPTMFPVFYKAQ